MPTGETLLSVRHSDHPDWTGAVGWVAGMEPLSVVLPDLPVAHTLTGGVDELVVGDAELLVPAGAYPAGTALTVQLLSGPALLASPRHLSFVDGLLRPVLRSELTISTDAPAATPPTVELMLPVELSAHDAVVYAWDGSAWSTPVAVTVVDEQRISLELPAPPAGSTKARSEADKTVTLGVCAKRGPAGVIKAVRGTVTVEGTDPDGVGYSRSAQAGDTLGAGESVVTGKNSYAKVDAGGQALTMGAKTTLDQTQCSDNAAGSTNIVNTLQGLFLHATRQKDDAKVKAQPTRSSTIGVRGTVFLAEERADGLYVEVTDGAVDVSDGAETWTVDAGQSLLCPSCLAEDDERRRTGAESCGARCSDDGTTAFDAAGQALVCGDDEACELDDDGDARCVSTEGGGGSGGDDGGDDGEEETGTLDSDEMR